MNNLLVFFALPISTIILAIAVEKILRDPLLTAATFFAIYLVISFAFFDETFLVFSIIYTIFSFIVALIVEIFFYKCKFRRKCEITGISDNNDDNENGLNSPKNQEDCVANNWSNERITTNITNNSTIERNPWRCYKR